MQQCRHHTHPRHTTPHATCCCLVTPSCLPASLQFGNGTLRLTTRQAYQLHGVLKQDLKTVFSSVVMNMGSTLGACGDVNRNVMGPAGVSCCAVLCCVVLTARLQPAAAQQ